MLIHFYKYQGTGNDFIIIDNRLDLFPSNNLKIIKNLCDRKFGIGADGLMLLENSIIGDFKMIYFNSDGNLGSMCGNGGRCIVAFANLLNIFKHKTTFESLNKIYHGEIVDELVLLKMTDVENIETYKNYLFLDTGSPHHISFVKDISKIDVYIEGKKIRYGSPYFEKGTNVNFVEQINENSFKVRTYERGVENETLSCGTGVTAVGIAAYQSKKTKSKLINIETLGGVLNISFEKNKGSYQNITLTGPAKLVFKGEINI